MIPAQSPRTNLANGPRPDSPWPQGQWQTELASAVGDIGELLRTVGVPPEAVDVLPSGAGFPLRVPRPYVRRMRPGDADDPLLRQVLPTAMEAREVPGYRADALDEATHVVDVGLLQKYRGRALVIAAGSCAVHCRYCFRRHFPYARHRQGKGFPSLDAVRRDASITEVILSGGDPLMLTDTHLADLVEGIGEIDHVTRLRIHTRLPVVIPQRVTAELVDTLATARPKVVVVTHFNHPNEVDDDCVRAMGALGRFTLLNQSVLLQGVNDDLEALVGLSERLFVAGVLPYYLHMPDAVAATAHFDVPLTRAIELHQGMAARLPGYLVPRLVRETPGAASKELVAPEATFEQSG